MPGQTTMLQEKVKAQVAAAERERERVGAVVTQERTAAVAAAPAPPPPVAQPAPAPPMPPAPATGPTPMEEDAAPSTIPMEVPASAKTVLEGHGSEVYICSWSPTEPLLASGYVGAEGVLNMGRAQCMCRHVVHGARAWEAVFAMNALSCRHIYCLHSRPTCMGMAGYWHGQKRWGVQPTLMPSIAAGQEMLQRASGTCLQAAAMAGQCCDGAWLCCQLDDAGGL